MQQRTSRRILGTLAALALVGCGGGSNGPTDPGGGGGGGGGTPPPGSFHTVLMGGVPFILNPDTVMFRNVDNPPVGTLDVKVDWPGGGDLNLYVTAETCTNFQELRNGRCTVMGKAETAAKPETVRFQTTANRTYTVWIHNNSASRESGSFDVGITTSQPVAAPTPTPGTDPRAGLAPGPVSRVALYIYQIRQSNGAYRDKFQDSRGRWILHPGEFVVFDSTQLNAAGDKCVWVNNPEYVLEDSQRVLSPRNSSQPFLFRSDVVGKGEFRLRSSIDGIDSAILTAVSE